MRHRYWSRIFYSDGGSVWRYVRGDFAVVMTFRKRQRLIVWSEGRDLAHCVGSAQVRHFLRKCWHKHIASLSNHEFVQYVLMGLIAEDDLIEMEGCDEHQ